MLVPIAISLCQFLTDAASDRLYQLRSIVPRTTHISADQPCLHLFSRAWSQEVKRQLCRVSNRQPPFIVLAMKYDRHSIVNRFHEFVGVNGDDCIGLQRLPGDLVLLFIPKASEREEFSVLHGNGVWLLRLLVNLLPLIKPIGRNQTTTTLPRFTVHGSRFTVRRARRDRFGLGVDRVTPSCNPSPRTERDPIA